MFKFQLKIMEKIRNGILLCFIVVLTLCIVSARDSCFTPNSEYGRCVPIKQCTFATDILSKYTITSLPANYADILRSLQCENKRDIHICCDAKQIATTYELNLNSKGLSILSAQNCGKERGNRIANGMDTYLAEFPWMALLRYDTAKQEFKCGGSLITNRYVLTAAHCVEDLAGYNLIGVRLGEYDLSTALDCQVYSRKRRCTPPVEDFGIDNFLSHPEYSSAYKTYDAALIKLDRNAQFQSHIRPICLPTNEVAAQIIENYEFLIAGWGFTEKGSTSNVLQKEKVTYKSLEVCKQIFKRTRLTDIHICAGGNGNVDSCKGDSGGPLFNLTIYDSNSIRYVQYGIISFGTVQCGANITYPGIYTNVVQLMPWISNNIE